MFELSGFQVSQIISKHRMTRNYSAKKLKLCSNGCNRYHKGFGYVSRYYFGKKSWQQDFLILLPGSAT